MYYTFLINKIRIQFRHGKKAAINHVKTSHFMKKKSHIPNQIFTLSEKIRVVVLSLLRCWYFLILRVVEVKAFVSFKKRHNDEVFRVDNILPALNYVVPQKKADKLSVTFPFGFSLLQIIHSIDYSYGLNWNR